MRGKTVVAIHQPNFFPWLGYFDKLARCDVFILLDSVQFPKKGGSWLNRVQLLIDGKAGWVTMPVVRSYHGTRLINAMQIDNTTPWRQKLLRTAQMNYARAPFFHQVFPFITSIVNNPTDHLAGFNKAAVELLAEAVGLDKSKFVESSTLGGEGTATDLLVSLTRAVDGTAYLCGGGAKEYQEDEKLAAAGIKVTYQDFVHPVYPQCNTAGFIPGLSIIDALMNVGIDGVRAMLSPPISASQ